LSTPKENRCDSCHLPPPLPPLHCRFLESFDEKSKRKKDGSCHMQHAKRSWGYTAQKEMLAFFILIYGFSLMAKTMDSFLPLDCKSLPLFIYVEQPLEYKLITCPCPRALPGVKRDLVKERNFSKAKLPAQKINFALSRLTKQLFAP
jgi:hypothetical protein